ncbi:hypothetical protein DBR42_04460 [Pelomonas sp. HMWF004]|nr:hypothetical protein DBR42_04460 [Pelomonas sp. HMWF004]
MAIAKSGRDWHTRAAEKVPHYPFGQGLATQFRQVAQQRQVAVLHSQLDSSALKTLLDALSGASGLYEVNDAVEISVDFKTFSKRARHVFSSWRRVIATALIVPLAGQQAQP